MDLVLKQGIKASPEQIFEAFTSPDLLSKWFTTNAKVDLRVGGRYSNDDLDEGSYLEINKPHRLVFTWENKEHCPGTKVAIDILDISPQSCEVSLTHSMLASEKHVEDMHSGWLWALDNIRMFLEEGRTMTHDEWWKVKNINENK